jgi:predicted O-methyltransferase YrrM
MDFGRVNAYIENLYRPYNEFNKAAFVQASRLKDFIPTVDDDVARFLKLMVRIARPKRVLEIGTSIGFSTCAIAQILKEFGGSITTIEFDPVVAAQAQENFRNLALDDVIDLRLGDACEIVPALAPPYDMIFQDVDKNLYPKLLPECLRLLRPAVCSSRKTHCFRRWNWNPGGIA